MPRNPHSTLDMDFSACRFFIRRLNSHNPDKPAEIPSVTLPLIGFIYVTSGEVLVETGGNPYLCQTGHARYQAAAFSHPAGSPGFLV